MSLDAKMQIFFKKLIDRHMDEYIANDSDYLCERCNRNGIEWLLSSSAYNYHDESWTDYTGVTLRISEIDLSGSDFTEGLSDDCNVEYAFRTLIEELSANAQAVYWKKNPRHKETREELFGNVNYWYTYDLEFIFKAPFGYDFDIHLRCVQYNDRH